MKYELGQTLFFADGSDHIVRCIVVSTTTDAYGTSYAVLGRRADTKRDESFMVHENNLYDSPLMCKAAIIQSLNDRFAKNLRALELRFQDDMARLSNEAYYFTKTTK